MPSGASASITALATAGGAPLVPASPTPLTPNGLKRIGGYGFAESERRHIAGAHHRVIHQRAGEHLAVFAEEHLFAQRFAEALRHAAVNLALDDHRVDDYAAVIDQHELLDGRLAGFAIDRTMATCAPKPHASRRDRRMQVSWRPGSMPGGTLPP